MCGSESTYIILIRIKQTRASADAQTEEPPVKWTVVTRNPRTGKIQNIKSGGHGQSALDVMDKNGIKYNIVKTYPNGVRVGNIPSIHTKTKKTGTGMAWFPKSWSHRTWFERENM